MKNASSDIGRLAAEKNALSVQLVRTDPEIRPRFVVISRTVINKAKIQKQRDAAVPMK